MEFRNEYGHEHNLEWIMQLIVLNMDVIVNEMWLWMRVGYIVDNLGSPGIGKRLTDKLIIKLGLLQLYNINLD